MNPESLGAVRMHVTLFCSGFLFMSALAAVGSVLSTVGSPTAVGSVPVATTPAPLHGSAAPGAIHRARLRAQWLEEGTCIDATGPAGSDSAESGGLDPTGHGCDPAGPPLVVAADWEIGAPTVLPDSD